MISLNKIYKLALRIHDRHAWYLVQNFPYQILEDFLDFTRDRNDLTLIHFSFVLRYRMHLARTRVYGLKS